MSGQVTILGREDVWTPAYSDQLLGSSTDAETKTSILSWLASLAPSTKREIGAVVAEAEELRRCAGASVQNRCAAMQIVGDIVEENGGDRQWMRNLAAYRRSVWSE